MPHLAPRAALAAAALALATGGCALVFSGGHDECDLQAGPAIAPAPLRNPDTLACETFDTGGCIPGCGLCPEVEPWPSWGVCGGVCDGLDESACAADAGCRVVKDAACAIWQDCTTDYVGCFPVDQAAERIDCWSAHDGWSCSRSAACTAYHRDPDPLSGERTFAMCAPAGQTPGSCSDVVVCDAVAPSCPTDAVPGVADGCYTGGCIPRDVCGVPL